jgi:hypothetical protein
MYEVNWNVCNPVGNFKPNSPGFTHFLLLPFFIFYRLAGNHKVWRFSLNVLPSRHLLQSRLLLLLQVRRESVDNLMQINISCLHSLSVSFSLAKPVGVYRPPGARGGSASGFMVN